MCPLLIFSDKNKSTFKRICMEHISYKIRLLSITNTYFLVGQGQNRHFPRNWFKCIIGQTLSAASVICCGERLSGVSVAQRLCICYTN